MEIIIEHITRGHKVIGCHKYAQADIKVGRAYSSDLIISDPHVCPTHLSIHFDGEQWIAHNESDINGSHLEKDKSTVEHHVIESGDVISFGKSQIRLIFPSHPVPESVPFSPFEQLVDFARHPAVFTTNLILFTLVAAWIIFLNKPIETTFTQLAVPAIGMTLGFSLWPALVALISHLTKNDARVMHQFGICFVFFNLMWLSDWLESLVYFNTSASMAITSVITILPIALAFSMFWLNSYIGFHMSATRRIVTAMSLSTLLFGGGLVVQLSKAPDFSPLPSYDATLMTPSFLFSGSSDVDTFIQDSERLFEKTKRAAEKDK